MAEKFKEYLQECVNKSYDELLAQGKVLLVQIDKDLSPLLGDHEKVSFFLINLIGAGIACDGAFSEPERRFLSELFVGCDLTESVERLDRRTYAGLDEVVDAMPTELKSLCLMLVATVISVDERINRPERRFIDRLLAQ